MKQQVSTRTHYSMKNATISMSTKILAIVFGFFARMVFTHMLSIQYAGVNGLFTNILGALNVADLGIGTALVYSIYEPAAHGDIPKQRALLKLYDQIYKITAAVVLVIGLIMYPILRIIMTETIEVKYVYLIYGMFLARTVFSYFFMYRSTIFLANQRNYVNDMIDSLILVIQNIIQIALLLATRNYYLYLVIYVLMILVRNFLIYRQAEKEYPEVFEKTEDQVGETEKKEVYKNMRAMLMHKVGAVIITNIDNLTLTGIVGIAAVGMYSNYYLIIGSIRQIIDRIVYGIAGSVGNLGATENKERVKKVFLGTFFMVAVGYGTAAIVIYEIVDVFVEASFGTEYVFPKLVTFVLCMNLYLNGVRQASLIFRDSLGLFWNDRYKTMVESLVNLVFSIILARKMGAAGVFIGTTISIVGISMWVEPRVLYRDFFHTSVSEYFLKLLKYTVLFALSWLIVDGLNRTIPWSSDLMRYFGMLIISCIVPPVIMLSINWKTSEFQFVLRHLKPKKYRQEAS